MSNKEALENKDGVWIRFRISPEANQKLGQLMSKEHLATGEKPYKELFVSEFVEKKILEEPL